MQEEEWVPSTPRLPSAGYSPWNEQMAATPDYADTRTGFKVTPMSSSRAALESRPRSTTQTGSSTSTQKGSSTSTQTVEFMGERPADFEQPEWDEGAIKKRAAQIAAPRIRQLRQAVQQELVKHYENPNVRKMMVRSALQGYGIGLGSVISGAQGAAQSEYAKKYSFDMQAAMANFNALWSEYMGARKTTTTGETTGTTIGETLGTTGYEYMGEPETGGYPTPMEAARNFFEQPAKKSYGPFFRY